MMFSRAFTLAALVLAQQVHAQPGRVPPEVIRECTEEEDASKLPECLKNGTLAFEMLAIAQTSEFYGESASPIVEACRSSNATFQGTWTCFKVAAEKAVETKRLIGFENIADKCVAAVSNEALHSRLEEEYGTKRREMFPDETFLGLTMYHPFRGCEQARK